MEFFEAEGQYNPLAAPFPPDDPDCAREGWGGLLGEAQTAILVTLDELALLAGISTAETATHAEPNFPPASERSAYSLLLEPALFHFPS